MKFRNGRAIGLLTAALALFLPAVLWGQSTTLQTDQLVRASDIIVVGRVGALKSEWNADKSRIQTVVKIQVDETMKGAVEGGALTVVVPGGEIDGVGEWYSHSVRFKDSEDVVVFAKKDKKGIMRVTDGEHGKFLVTEGKKIGSRVIANIGSLDEFTSHVKKTAKAQTEAPADR